MELWGVFLLVFVLYARTIKYNYLIDDNVKRDGYLYEVPEVAPHPDFYKTSPSPWYRVFMIAMHATNSVLVGMLFGWKAGLLFAVHPIGVTGTAWVTGNYYATTAYFTLIGMWFLFNSSVVVSMALFYVALQSTITCISVPFVFIFAGPLAGVTWLLPLIMYMSGKRFRTGIKLRQGRVSKISGDVTKFTYRRVAAMVKVMAFYIKLALFPIKLCFFREFGDCYTRKDVKAIRKIESFDKDFWVALAILAVFATIGVHIHIFGTCFFLITIAAFSQYKILGQFVAERYLYLPIIGVCILLANSLSPTLFACVFTAYLIRTVEYIPCFKNMTALYTNDYRQQPEWSLATSNLAQCVMMDGPFGIAESHVLLQKASQNPIATYEIDANLAACYTMMKHYKNALKYTRQALVKAEGTVSPLIYTTLQNQERELLNVVKKSNRFAPAQL